MPTTNVVVTYKYCNKDRPQLSASIPDGEPFDLEYALLEQIMIKEQPGLQSLSELVNVNPVGAVNTKDEGVMSNRVLAACLEVDLVRYVAGSEVTKRWVS